MEDCKDVDILTVTTTVGSLPQAQVLARALLDGRLAACVQLDERLQSLYRWQGKLCEEAEVRLTIKTLPHLEAALRETFRQHHPYELPQFLAWTMRASPAYSAWVRGEVSPPAPAAGPAPPP